METSISASPAVNSIEYQNTLVDTGSHSFQAIEMVALGLVILMAHLGGRICRYFRVSEVTGQLLGGALAGPFALHACGLIPDQSLVYDQAIGAFNFFIFTFLSIVAFGIGEELHLSRLRRVGLKALVVSVVHGLVTWVLISGVFLCFSDMNWLMALLLGSTGVASAPAVTFVLMNKLRVEGHLRHMLASVVVLADLIGICTFSLLLQITMRAQRGEALDPLPVIEALAEEVGMAMLLGAAIWAILRVLVFRRARSLHVGEGTSEAPNTPFLQRLLAEHPSPSAEILLVVLGAVSLGTGMAYLYEWPFLITAIFGGFLVANLHSHAIFDSLKIDAITPVFNLIFFALMGSTLAFDQIRMETLWFAVLYVSMRMLGKMGAGWLGCKLAGEDPKVSACLPALLLPQAGVAAVEAVYASAILCDGTIAAIVLPAIVFFQVAGVYLTERSLLRWRSWLAGEQEALSQDNSPSPLGIVEAARRIRHHLCADAILLDLEVEDKSAAISALVKQAQSISEHHLDLGTLTQVLGEREKLAPTGMGHGFALPHCRLMGVEDTLLVFARHPEGISWGGVDDSPCDLMLLMITSARKPAVHLKMLAAIAHVMGDDEVRRELRCAATPDEFLDVLECLGARRGRD